MTTKRKTKPKKKWAPLEFWESGAGVGIEGRCWFWHLQTRNGRIVADGAEGYSSEAKARQGFRAAAKLAAKALSELERK